MIGHLGLNVSDLGEPRVRWARLAPLVGMAPYLDGPDEVGFRPATDRPGAYLFLYQAAEANPYSKDEPGPQHLAFAVRSNADVDRAHRHAVGEGWTIVHPPREFPEYPPPYYATFFVDPDGFTIEVVCHRGDHSATPGTAP